MKIDMSGKAVANRLKTVNQLRKACLSLSNSSAGKRIRVQFSSNKSVQRTSHALGLKRLVMEDAVAFVTFCTGVLLSRTELKARETGAGSRTGSPALPQRTSIRV